MRERKYLMTDQIYGNLKIIKLDEVKTNSKYSYYICECQCEKKTIKSIRIDSLLNGGTKSCGCLTQELRDKTHNINGTPYKSNPQGRMALIESNKKRAKESAERLIGKTFNYLTIKSVHPPKVTCECICGKEKIAYRSAVVSGKTTSCGCMRSAQLRSNRPDWKSTRVGEKYNMLTIIEDLKGYRCKAKCDCGNIKEYFIGNLSKGDIKSCGCKTVEMRHETNLRKYNSKTPSVCISKAEREMSAWIESLGVPTTRKLIKNPDGKYFELDIVIESKGLAIEHNGARWHHDQCEGKDKWYHLNKTEAAKKAGYRLIHIFDFEWSRNSGAVKSFIRSALGMNEIKIGARKCEVKSVPTKDAKEFLNQYHILGFVPGSHYIGLYHKDELVSVSVFRKHHVKNEGLVLARWCGKDNVTVQGGLSRLMKSLKRFIPDATEVISWADYRLSEATGYLSSGWEIDKILKPDYFYYDPNKKKVIYKYMRRKTVANTPEGMTEKEHAKSDGLYRIWDCGKIRMIYKV